MLMINYWTQIQKDGYELVHECIYWGKSCLVSLRENITSPTKLFHTFIKTATSISAIALIGAYFVMMAVKPWYDGGGDWLYVHEVWSNWQTLNAAMIAFSASLVAVYAARYSEEKKRKRQLIAARAMLPQALSDFTEHTTNLANFYIQTYEYWRIEDTARDEKPVPPEPSINDAVAIFSNCMQHANIEVVEIMAKILSMNQYISARAQSEYKDRNLVRRASWRFNIESQLCELGEMQALINRMFSYGRELQSDLDLTNLTEQEISQGMRNINIVNCPAAYEYLAGKFGSTP
ncbi:hypothetical protein ACK1CN_00700 [Vibrio coralliilyticus]|uniref:hypothetical protein n=1 Tax=Vibrio coralliilyticus TaxID=190893 RepID=UPI00391717E2